VKRRLSRDLLWLGLLAGVGGMAYWQRLASPARPASLTPVDERAAVQDLRFETGADDRQGGASLNRDGVDLARLGRFGEATEKLRAALRALPSSEIIGRNLQEVLTAWGFQEMQHGQPVAAADHFLEALEFGRRSQTLSGLGLAYVQSQRYGEAIAVLEEALGGGAKDGGTYLALGEAYEATDERVRALEMMQRATEAGVQAPALRERIERLGREVDAEWDFSEETSSHFQVRFDAGEDRRAAQAVLRSLESAYDLVGRKFAYYPERPTPVVLYAEQDFHHITQTPDWAGAVFDGRLKFPVRGLVEGAELDRVTRHEYAHSLIETLSENRAPAWLNEGLAMWAEELSPGDRREWAERVLEAQPPLPLAALTRSFSTLPAEAVQVAYAQSYLTILFLADNYDERRIGRLLEALRQGGSLESAFADVYPVTLDRFEDSFAKSLG
jgi:tetratricopeptide (TPR) repeat protein